MSKRNLTLLIIALVIITVFIWGFWYFNKTIPSSNPNSGGTNFGFIFNPFGKTTPAKLNQNNTTNSPADVSGYTPTSGSATQNVKLNKVSSMPIAGFGIFMKERFKDVPAVVPATTPTTNTTTSTAPTPPSTEFMPAIRYVDRATGNIYQTFADKIEERKFSTTLIPRVYEAYFGNKGESVIMRYLKEDDKTIQTFVGTLPKEYLGADSVGTNEITGSFLPDNISDISISPDTTKIFYLFNSGGNVIGTTADVLGNKKVQVFSSPFTEWLSSWPNNKIITITTKPSANVPGFVYAINPDKKDFNKVFGGINGMTTLMGPDGKSILYNNNDLSLNIFHIDTGNSDKLGVKTLPEKCVWGSVGDVLYCAVPNLVNGALYPDIWYKGEISFSDTIWKIDLKTGNTTMIFDPTTIADGEEIDGIKLTLDSSENYLFFVNKKDSFLWELNLK